MARSRVEVGSLSAKGVHASATASSGSGVSCCLIDLHRAGRVLSLMKKDVEK